MTHSARSLSLGIGAAALGALLLGACSSSTTPSSATTSPSGTTPGGTSAASSGIGALSSEAASAEHATFSATYSVMTTSSSGGPQTVTIEQDPPASAFTAGSGTYIETGTKTYFCSTASSGSTGQTCLETSQTTNPLAGLLTLFNPSTAVQALQAAEAEASSHVAGYSVTTSSGTYGGQSAQCADISAQGHSAKYCVTSAGILAYEGSGGNGFTLTKYSSSVNPSDFAVPAGATVETVPSTP